MNALKIKSLIIHSDKEVIKKLTHELLDLFHISVGVGESRWETFLETEESSAVFVRTTLMIDDERFFKEETGFSNEKPSGAVHRLYKKHLYEILREKYGFPPALWGILHGVRPTKIVQRYFKDGLTEGEVFNRLTNGYYVSEEKANLLLEVARNEEKFCQDCDSKKVAVYIGIPFCLSKCFYCSFPSHILPGEKKLSEFMEVFKRDLSTAKDLIKKYNLKVESVYIGGGTPTALPDLLFAETMNLASVYFVGEDLKEFTVEAGRPDSMSENKYNVIFDSPVTRVSVNPQTMNERTLEVIGRKHTAKSITEMYNAFRKKENLEINMDLILGLPTETSDDAENTIRQIIALNPDNITLHALARKKGSLLKTAMNENVHIELPTDDEAQKMAKISHKLIRDAGYKPYYLYRQGYMSGGLENIGFSKEGKESVYNVKIIEENQTIIGIGGAATTKIVDEAEKRIKATFHPKDLITYLRDIDLYIEKRDNLLKEVFKC